MALSNKVLEEKLCKAARDGNVQEIIRLLDQGADIDAAAALHLLGTMTPLMWATLNGHMECVKVLLDRGAQVNMHDKYGETALMKASFSEHMECVKVLLDRGAEVNMQDKYGETALMRASGRGHMECVTVLLDRGADVNMQNEYGETALMKASFSGHRECVKVLLDRGAEVNMQDKVGETALMIASRWGRMECVTVLLNRGAEVNMQDKEGDTALHIAARKPEFERIKEVNTATCVRALLSHPGIDISIKSNEGRTAMMKAGYKSLCVFKQVLKTCNDYPADSYGKVVLCGNSGAGKSTLTQAIINFSKPAAARLVKVRMCGVLIRFHEMLSEVGSKIIKNVGGPTYQCYNVLLQRIFGQEEVVEPLTAGIIPHQVDSPYSNMVVYDLAGHHQYFSSHAACLEAISLNSPAIFLLLQDLRKGPEVMTKEVYYWSTLIDGVCHKCPQQSSVIVVGTHADLLTPEQLKENMSHLQSIAKMAISHQIIVNVLALNLTKIYSGEMEQFKDLLYGIIKNVLSMSPPILMMCHMLLAFLRENLPPDIRVDSLSLSDLIGHLQRHRDDTCDQDNVIDPDRSSIIPLLETLSEKGLILFIPSDNPLNSWIVLHKESILKKVNGALFADPSLKEYIRVASNTGIVPKAVIQKIFPEYNIEMITKFMIHFELCQAVDLSQVDTNMAPEGSSSSDLGPLFFFPALVNVVKPSSATVPNNSFCWSMIVKSSNRFFTTRYLHVLLRRLPSEFALPAVQATPSHLNRRCDVWSRGLKWLSNPGVTTILEMSEMFQSLSLAMSSHDKTDPKYLELVHSVLAVIKKACQDFCPHLEVLEVISCPPEASSDHSDDTQVELSALKQALEGGEKYAVDVSSQKHVMIDKWMTIEPCLPYLVEASPEVPSYSSACNLKDLMNYIATKIPVKWKFVGIQLGLSSSTLDSIQADTAGKPHACIDSFHQVFSAWEKQGPSPYTWDVIINVLRTPAVGEVALADKLDALHLK